MGTFGGQVGKDREFGKKIGLFEARVVAFNPNREELDALLKTNIEKEPEYLGEKDDVKNVRISVWVEQMIGKEPTGNLFNLSYFIQNKDSVSKSGKKQFINDAGRSTYAVDENALKSNFVKTKNGEDLNPRVAKVGEVEFVGLLDAMMKLDRKQAYSLLPDMKPIFKGDLSQISAIINTEIARTITALAYVRVVEKDGDVKEYQGVYSRKVLPGYMYKTLSKTKWTEDKVEALRVKRDTPKSDGSRNFLSNEEDFVVQLMDEEYGLKDPFVLTPLKDYDKDEFQAVYDKVSSPHEAVANEADDADY